MMEKEWKRLGFDEEGGREDMGESAVKQLARVSKVGVCWIMKRQDPCGYVRSIYYDMI